MFCPSCGAEHTKNVDFCDKCGKQLQHAPTKTYLPMVVLSIIVLFLVLFGTIGIGLYFTRSMPQNGAQITNNTLKPETPTPTLTPTIAPTLTPTIAPTPMPTTAPTSATHSQPANNVPSSNTNQYNQGYNAGWNEADANIFTFISLNCSPVATVYLSGYGQQWGQIDCNVSGSSNTLYYDDSQYSQYGQYWDGARLGYKDRMDKLWNYMWGNCRNTVASVHYNTDSNGTHITCYPN